ncbi:MAG: LamG-like jellyroll fold domain-containing protein, partial [Opitutae bacterium]
GLTGSLPSSHTYALGAPTSTSGSPSYITDTPFGSGKAIDLADGHVEVLTGGTEDVFDGGTAFSVSAWVKGWPDQAFDSIISKGPGLPADYHSGMLLWLDAQNLNSMDKGSASGQSGTPNDGQTVGYWADLSGNDLHLSQSTSASRPQYDKDAINGLPGLYFIDDFLGKNSVTMGGDTLSVIWVFEQYAISVAWGRAISFLASGQSDDGNNVGSFTIGNRGNSQSFWVKRNNVEKVTPVVDNNPVVATAVFNGSNCQMYINGKNIDSFNTSGNFATSGDLMVGKNINRRWLGSIAEIRIYRDALSDTNRESVEGHLHYKWRISGIEPSSHASIPSTGWSVGRALDENSVSSTMIEAGGAQDTTHSTSLSNGESWHHLVSTYDGETRKVFLDGTEISSKTAYGLVSPSPSALLFGASDMNRTSADSEETKNVAAANHSGIKLDEIRFYNSALTSQQVTNLYNLGKGDLNKVGDFSTLPTVINGTAGTALSATVTANFSTPTPVYSAKNLPDGLSINSSTGVISGTPSVGGSHVFTVIAEGGSGDSLKRASANITYSAPS